jgi:hypothetical protein
MPPRSHIEPFWESACAWSSRALPAERDACNPLWINYPVTFSYLYQSGPRMTSTKSDWLVYNLNLL